MAEGGEKRSPTGHRTPSQVKRQTRTYGATAEQKKKRAARGRARTLMKNKLGATAIAGKDIDHKKPLSKGGSNSASNLRVKSVKSNRGHGMTSGKKANMNKGRKK